MLQLITTKLSGLAVTRPLPVDDGWCDAAILLALTRHQEDPKLILTKRAEHLSSHRGEVAFPGGKWEIGDQDLLMTALRETKEEIGLASNLIDIVASMPADFTRYHARVKPYIGLVPEGLSLQANPEELDAVFEVPVSFFLDQSNLTVAHFVGPDYRLNMPCYIYQGYKIWGFSLMVLTNFLNSVLSANIQLQYPDGGILVKPDT